MFMDYILESERVGSSYDYNDHPITEETMREIENIPVADFSESALTPFELMTKAIDEFAMDNTRMANSIMNAELKYIKEHGVEPVWESSDSDNIFGRFINFVKSIISKITGAFEKLIASINKRINAVYDHYGNKLIERGKNLSRSALNKKKFKIKQYNLEIGKAILDRNPYDVVTDFNPKAVNKNYDDSGDGKKGVYYKWDKGDQDDLTKPTKDRKAVDTARRGRDEAANIYKKIFEKHLTNEKDIDWSNSASVKGALNRAMISKPKDVNYSVAEKEIKYFIDDHKGIGLKKQLKDRYNQVKKDLSGSIDRAKSAASKMKGYDAKVTKAGNNEVGLYINGLNKYVQAMTMTYKTTSAAYTQRWFQSLNLYIKLTGAASSVKRETKKNESFEFSFE